MGQKHVNDFFFSREYGEEDSIASSQPTRTATLSHARD